MIPAHLRILNFAALCFALIAGCNTAESSGPQRYPVKGKILVDGVPPAGAIVKFVLENTNQASGISRTPAAVVREDGSFSASYLDTDDGAPKGKYKLLLYWMQSPPEGGLPIDRLKGRFSSENNPIARIEVKQEENQLETILLRMPVE